MGKRLNEWLCKVGGHIDEEIGRKRAIIDPASYVERRGAPAPEPGFVFIESFMTLHAIAAIDDVTYKCKRCGATRVVPRSEYFDEPFQVSDWIKFPLQPNSRLVLPPNYTQIKEELLGPGPKLKPN